jgi:hypothetical protein
VIATFLGIAVIFIPIGAAILAASDSVIDVGPIRYDGDQVDESLASHITHVSFTWPKDTTETVYMYYQLSNFYQNHRRYVKSRSDIQLAGTSAADKKELGDCDPWEHFDDHEPNTPIEGADPDKYSSYVLNPCGLIANSMFNDTFNMFEGECHDDTDCASHVNMTSEMSGKDIAWASDKEKKFKNLKGWDGTPSLDQQIDVENEEFIVWMRTAGLPTFKKLHRKIKGGLKKGTYTMRIDQRFKVQQFEGGKSFYLSTVTWIGGKNDFLGWSYIVVGILSVVVALAFAIKEKIHPRSDPRPARS